MKKGDPLKPGTCGAETRSKTPCAKTAGWGTQHAGTGRCKLHGGASPQAELAGIVHLARHEATVMGQPLDIEPHEAILQCIAIAAGEVRYASDQIAELEADQVLVQSMTTKSRPLSLGKEGEDADTLVEEITTTTSVELHVWIVVRQKATDRLVTYAAAALKAGVEERRVRIAEDMASQIAQSMRAFAIAMGLDPRDAKVRAGMRASLTVIEGGLAA